MVFADTGFDKIKTYILKTLYYAFLIIVPILILLMLATHFILVPDMKLHILNKLYLHVYHKTEINMFPELHLTKQKIKVHSISQIKHHIEIMLYYFNRYMSDENITTLSTILHIGEKQYAINHFDVLAIIGVESRFKITAVNVNTNQSIDYGLTQQNSNYIVPRFYKASQILTTHGIQHDINNNFDIALNTLSCILFLDTLRTATSKNLGVDNILFFDKFHQIGSYNTGIVGIRTKRDKAKAYFKRFNYYKNLIVIMS